MLASSVGLSTAGATLANFSMVNSALAASSAKFEDHKALVCVFLFGGNDSFNMLVPTADNHYQTYQNVRQGLAFEQASLLSISPATEQPYALGMPAAMAPLQSLFNENKLAFLANAGPLLQPVNKTQALNNWSLLPPQLFSHNDQQNHWQTSWPEQSTNTGWAGRMADLIMDTANPLSMNYSLSGTNTWQTGTQAIPYTMHASGLEQFDALNPEQEWNAHRVDVFNQLLNANEHVLGKGYANVIHRAQNNIAALSGALESVPDSSTVYPESDIAQQLKMVANLCKVQQTLGQQRQVFYVGMGGFDTHDVQATSHPALLRVLSEALAAFQLDLDTAGIDEQVTTFTMSDFGRTLTSNGDGTDHGWGGHQIIMGGAVNGGNIYGTMPEDLSLNSADDLGDGRMLPTTSVDQYAATLSRWFGLSENEINAVLPNLSRFNNHDIGFMNS